jgi:hypothetical protein
MISEYLSSLHLRLKAGRPPNDLSLIQEVGSIDWRNINDEEVDLACEIILRVVSAQNAIIIGLLFL